MREIEAKFCCKTMEVREAMKRALTDENGETNIIAIIIILAIVILLAILFRSQIFSLFNRIWGSLTGNVDSAIS